MYKKRILKSVLSLVLSFVLLSGATQNEQVSAQAVKKPVAAETKTIIPPTLPPAYNDQMLELAETLGSLHYLRELCKANEGQIWREQMDGLIKAEDPTVDRRAELIAHFNRGFRSYREIYSECTHVAVQAANRHLDRSVKITSEIPSRYGK